VDLRELPDADLDALDAILTRAADAAGAAAERGPGGEGPA